MYDVLLPVLLCAPGLGSCDTTAASVVSTTFECQHLLPVVMNREVDGGGQAVPAMVPSGLSCSLIAPHPFTKVMTSNL